MRAGSARSRPPCSPRWPWPSRGSSRAESSGDAVVAAAAPWLALTLAVGAPLAVFTGFPKTAADLCVLTLALAVLGVRLVRDGRGHAAFGLTLAVALLDHRAALVFLPAAGYAVGGAWRGATGPAASALAMAPPLVTAGGHGAAHPAHRRGLRHAHALPRARRGRARRGVRRSPRGKPILEIANALLMTAPLVVLLPLLVLAPAAARAGARDTRYLLLLATAFVPVTLFVHPRQGLLRDWEVLTPAAVAFTALVVWTLGTLVATRQAAPRLAVAAAFATLVPGARPARCTRTSVDQGLARAQVAARGPPRADRRRARLPPGTSSARAASTLGRWGDATTAYDQLSRIKPTRSVFLSLGLGRRRGGPRGGDHAAARGRSRRCSPTNATTSPPGRGWATRPSSRATRPRAPRRARGSRPGARDPRVLSELLGLLRDMPRLWPALADSLARP